MTIHLSTPARNASTNAVLALIDVDAGAGKIEIRSGTQPADGDAVATGTVLAEVILVDPAFGTSSAGTATGSDPASINAVATGTASWFRVLDNSGDKVFDGSVTATGGGGDMTLSSTSIITAGPVDITALSYTTPG